MTDTPKSPQPEKQGRAIALAPAQIVVGNRLRTLKPARIATMVADMQVQGQLQPVLVVETETAGRFELIDGSYRLAALIECKAAFIEAYAMPAALAPELRLYAQIMANVTLR